MGQHEGSLGSHIPNPASSQRAWNWVVCKRPTLRSPRRSLTCRDVLGGLQEEEGMGGIPRAPYEVFSTPVISNPWCFSVVGTCIRSPRNCHKPSATCPAAPPLKISNDQSPLKLLLLSLTCRRIRELMASSGRHDYMGRAGRWGLLQTPLEPSVTTNLRAPLNDTK